MSVKDFNEMKKLKTVQGDLLSMGKEGVRFLVPRTDGL